MINRLLLIYFLIFHTLLFALDGRAIYQKMATSNVTIMLYDKKDKFLSYGSGFYVQKHMIATNFHVVADVLHKDAKGYIKFLGSDSGFEITIADYDERADLAIMHVDEAGTPLEFANLDDTMIGDTVYVLGTALKEEGTFSTGIISHIRQEKYRVMVQMTAPISKGNSGGAVVNKNAQVLAITTEQYNSKKRKDDLLQNLNYAVSIKHIQDLIQSYERKRDANQWERLSLGGNLGATYNMAMESMKAKRCDEAVRLLYRASNAGYIKAKHRMALLNYHGICVQQDIKKAKSTFLEIIKTSPKCSIYHLNARYMLGNIHFYWEQEFGKAITQYNEVTHHDLRCKTTKANRKIIAYSNYMAGYVYEHGLHDKKRAFLKYSDSARFGYSKAQYKLGKLYAKGQWIPQDKRKARILLDVATSNGDKKSQDLIKEYDLRVKFEDSYITTNSY